VIKNLTITNTAGDVGQAIALGLSGNRIKVENCKILGNQDALYTSGENAKHYFIDCYIEGTTDFIFGEATVLFENCIIHSKKNSYITAASTPENAEFGYVFKNCKLSAADSITEVFLGRPWRKFAKTVFLNCKMGNHILPQAWHNWDNLEAQKTTFYAEYNSSDEGSKPNERAIWSHQLTAKQVKKYTKETILVANWYEN
jgi:pectinesterase